MKKTTEIFSKEVIELTNNEYNLVSEYITNKIKVQILHKKCNNVYEVRPDRFIQGDRCPYCAKVKKYTTETYKNKVSKETNNEYEFIDTYKNNRTKSKYKHIKCGKEFLMAPNNFNYGHRCPYCSHPSKKKGIKDLLEEIKLQVGDEYTLVSTEYSNNKDKLIFHHNICNNDFISCADNFLNRKRRCPYCAVKERNIKHTLTHEQFLSKIDKNVFKDYEILTKYTKRKDKIKVLHKKCNNIYEVTADEFLAGNRCPYCKRSKGEERIENWLKDNNISFETQFKFSDCKYKRPLPFDFKININNNFILLEYDGIQHEKGYYIYNEEGFNLQKKRDSIKDEYCKKNNLKLVRISYKDYDNIDDILRRIINEMEY